MHFKGKRSAGEGSVVDVIMSVSESRECVVMGVLPVKYKSCIFMSREEVMKKEEELRTSGCDMKRLIERVFEEENGYEIGYDVL